MNNGLITVFGGSGFLGKYVVRALIKDGWRVRVPVRRPHTAQDLKVIGDVGQVQLVQANLRFEKSVDAAIEGSDAVINLVALLFESGSQNFDALHVKGAEVLAKKSLAHGVTNFIQVSALGASLNSDSSYSSTKAMGEKIIRDIIPSSDIVRPSIIFGAEDNFFNRFAAMTQLSPFIPILGGGQSLFQPVYVNDVAKVVAKLAGKGTAGNTYELGGPKVYSFKELMQVMLHAVDRKRVLIPVPWVASNFLGLLGEVSGSLPFVSPFLTRDQVKNLRKDNIVSEGALGFSSFEIRAETVESIIGSYLLRYRKYGQFHEKSN